MLCYLCGDHPALSDEMTARLGELARAGGSREVAIAVQIDRPGGAERYLLTGRGDDTPPAPAQIPGAVNTGDPDALSRFLRWGREACPARQTALLIAGLGIGHPQSVIGNPARDDRALFSFADDATARDALTPLKLQQALVQAFPDDDAPLPLLLLDMQTTQFLEVAYQLSGQVQVLVAPQTDADAGWHYTQLVRAWRKQIRKDRRAGRDTAPHTLAALAVEKAKSPNVSALNLARLEDLARAFDSLAQALLQSLGDDIIWQVVWDEAAQVAFNFDAAGDAAPHPLSLDLPPFLHALGERLHRARQEAIAGWYAESCAKLTAGQRAAVQKRVGEEDTPADALETRLTDALPTLPAWMADDFRIIQSQRQRADDLAALAARALSLLAPAPDGFLLARSRSEPAPGGVAIFRPRNLDKLSHSNYLELAFNRRVHWAALLGAISLIAEHPRALWRLASSLLTTTGGTVRENLLRRLIGPDSVMVGFRQQFAALAVPPCLTLSLEPGAPETDGPAATYRLRLESAESGATVIEQNSRVNTRTIEDALTGLETLLRRTWAEADELGYLQSLGRTLGEDIIQNLSEHLDGEYRKLAWLGRETGAPHLQLQLPRPLMRFPWELMHDGNDLLCERYALGRQVFMETGTTRQVTRRRSGVIRVLLIGDPLFEESFLRRAAEREERWAQLPGARAEAEEVARLFRQLQEVLGRTLDFDPRRDAFIGRPLTKLQLRELLRSGRYDIVHFAGHALFRPDHPEESAWLLSDGPLWAQEIRNTLAWTDSPPWLVFANACQAAMESGRRADRYQGDVFGLATAFINQGVAAYIGPLWPIEDAIALQMAADFYQALLLENATLGEALRFAKRNARRIAMPAAANGEGAAGRPPVATRVGLGWAAPV
ncbi:MAG: CHAT domain-containing protein, partial [Caldilineae bacterium]